MNIPSVSATGNRIMAISDVNNDKFNDLMTANTSGSVITVFYYSITTSDYGSSSQIILPADTYVRSIFVTRSGQFLQSLMLVVLDDSVPATPVTKLMLYTQS